jgi:SAM-dependent methyltransferase
MHEMPPLPLRLAQRKWLLTRYLSGRVALWRALTSLLPQAHQDQGLALDVGCGSRPFDRALAARGSQAVGMDAKALHGTVQGSGQLLPFKDEIFSLALCVNVLQYLDDPKEGCQEINRVLRPGATLLAVLPCFVPLDPEDRWRWPETAGRRLLRDAGFGDIVARPIMPTAATLLALMGLSVRKAIPFLGWLPAAFLEASALACLKTRNLQLVGAFAYRAVKT